MVKQFKKALRTLYFKTHVNPIVSRIRAAFISFDAEFRNERSFVEQKVVSTLSPDLCVLSGPFKGMKYPFLEAAGSVLVPKILGTYEKELHPYIEQIIKNNYSAILDISSAEGYYAVGFALRSPATKITAFDIDPRARELLLEMIKINDVLNRVTIKSLCDTQVLSGFANMKSGLIFSDCEGYELELFNDSTIEQLRRFDFLIETHDGLNVNITKTLTKRFRKTHSINLIKGRKRSAKDFPASSASNSLEKLIAVQEGRHRMSKWLFLKSFTGSSMSGLR